MRRPIAYFIYLQIHPCQVAGFLSSSKLGSLSHLSLLIALFLFPSSLGIRESSLDFAAGEALSVLQAVVAGFEETWVECSQPGGLTEGEMPGG